MARKLSAGRERAALGAAHLDNRMPGWATRIDIEQLDMQSSDMCVAAQLLGKTLFLSTLCGELGFASQREAETHGFITYAGEPRPARALQRAWKIEIEKRLTPAA